MKQGLIMFCGEAAKPNTPVTGEGVHRGEVRKAGKLAVRT